MWHGLFIGLHAAAGVVAFAAGCDALVRRRWFPIYLGSLVALVVFLGLAVAVTWSTLEAGTQLLFVAFIALGGFMVWRAWCAQRILIAARSTDPEPSRRYVRHLGFTLVALCDGFVVITVLNGGAPEWATAGVGVSVAVAGHFVIDDLERRLAAKSTVTTQAPPATVS
jgi:hypothetical protein